MGRSGCEEILSHEAGGSPSEGARTVFSAVGTPYSRFMRQLILCNVHPSFRGFPFCAGSGRVAPTTVRRTRADYTLVLGAEPTDREPPLRTIFPEALGFRSNPYMALAICHPSVVLSEVPFTISP